MGPLRQVVPGTLALAFELAARGTACEGARTEVGLPVTEVGSTPTATRTA